MPTTIKNSATLAIAAAAVLAMPAAHANLITNGGFEAPVNSGENFCNAGTFSVPGWGCFNDSLIVGENAFFGAPVSHDAGGGQALKLFGFDGGAVQTVAATAGETYAGSVWAMNYDADPFRHFAIFSLGFLDADGMVISELVAAVGEINGNASFPQLAPEDGADVSDWTQLAVEGMAPAGTVAAQFLLLHIFDFADPNPGSAIYFDDASLVVVPAPAALGLLAVSLMMMLGLRRRRAHH